MSEVGEALRDWQKQNISVMRQEEPLHIITEDEAEPNQYAEETIAMSNHKEPWQMTKAEYIKPPYTSPAMHKYGVSKALSEGKLVPAEVLKDYPDLQKKSNPDEPLIPDVVDIDTPIKLDVGITYCYAAWGIRFGEKGLVDMVFSRKSNADNYRKANYEPHFRITEVIPVKRCLLLDEQGHTRAWTEELT